MSTPSTLAVGPFDLVELLGRGGMGEVWDARHRPSGSPVAVKLLTGTAGARAEAFRTAFRNEVRLTLALDHPNVVRVLDHGVVPAASGHLQAQTPYLVMALGPRSTLSRHVGRLRWRGIRRVLDALLSALAHAHARGVVHRDVKPGNVLVDAAVSTIQLTDFGLAHAMEATPQFGARVFMGTPAYMAPEQFGGSWRDIGPWTDLYGLGCIAYALATGGAPFGPAPSFAVGRAAHLGGEVPPLPDGAPVPDGFGAWVRDLLVKNPGQRFQRAADARHALAALGDAPADALPLGRRADEDTVTLTSDVFADWPDDGGVDGGWDELSTTTRLSAGVSRPARPAPPLPEDWRRDHDTVQRPRLQDAGLRLIGLQPAPLVGREAERDALWAALRRTVAGGVPRAVHLPGPTGVGKRRLATWLCERAHELGSAFVLQARHDEFPGPGHGIGGMLDRFLTCSGLDRPRVLARLRQIHQGFGVDDPEVSLGLLAWIRPDDNDPTEADGSRFGAVMGFVDRLVGGGRPVILFLDEAQWGTDPATFATALLDGLRGPVLVLLTSTPELVAGPDVVAALDTLDQRGDVDRLPIAPLSEGELEDLLGWYRLAPPLVSQLLERSAGNPMYAVQLIGSWVERGLLDVSSDGLVLSRSVDDALAADLRDVWVRRLDRVLAGCSAFEAECLERAAVLGPSVDHADWDAVCRPHGAPLEALDRLMDQQLARPVGAKLGGGWTFVHPMLREALVARAEAAGRLPAHHEACVVWLCGRPGPGVPARLGRHLLGAGRPREALGPLLQAARERRAVGDTSGALGLLARRDEALERLNVPATDPRWAPGWLERARLHERRGETDARAYCLDRAREVARPGLAVAVEVQIEHAQQHLRDSEHAASYAVASSALDEARALGNRRLEARAAHSQARAAALLGQLDEAESLAADARAIHVEFRDVRAMWETERTLARVTFQRGDRVRARQHVQKALVAARRSGFAHGRAAMLVMLGDLARYDDDPPEAARRYRQAGTLFRRVGSVRHLAYVEHNLGLVQLETGDTDGARTTFEAASDLAERTAEWDLLADVRLGLAACAVAAGASNEAALGISEAMALYGRTGVADIDSVRLAVTGADLAVQAGLALREREFLDVALHHARALGRTDRVGALEARLADLVLE